MAFSLMISDSPGSQVLSPGPTGPVINLAPRNIQMEDRDDLSQGSICRAYSLHAHDFVWIKSSVGGMAKLGIVRVCAYF